MKTLLKSHNPQASFILSPSGLYNLSPLPVT
jgi:hypothetical protein